MCLVLFAYREKPRRQLIVAANRDEFYARPTRELADWDEASPVLAGQDLQAGGTWLGVTREPRFASVTNFRAPDEIRENAPSRGHLVSDFLHGSAPASEYLEALHQRGEQYSGFNLVLADGSGVYYYSNRSNAGAQSLRPGVYGLSNHLLDTNWPKVERGKQMLVELVEAEPAPQAEPLFDLLSDTHTPPDEALPDTGVGLELERRLGSIFIEGPGYGTRCSTAVHLDLQGGASWIAERSYSTTTGESTTRRFEFSSP